MAEKHHQQVAEVASLWTGGKNEFLPTGMMIGQKVLTSAGLTTAGLCTPGSTQLRFMTSYLKVATANQGWGRASMKMAVIHPVPESSAAGAKSFAKVIIVGDSR